MSARIEDLDLRVQGPVRKYVRRCKEEGIPVVVLETRRAIAVQIAYWLRSRAPVETVRAVFARLGLWAITDAEAATLSTKTLYSKHVDGLAADIAPAKPDGSADWDAPLKLWMVMWGIAEDECGLSAYGNDAATQWDKPHVEIMEAT